MRTLFDDRAPMELAIPEGTIRYWPEFLSDNRANRLMTQLTIENADRWVQSILRIGGRSVQIPRLNVWYDQKRRPYSYSGTTLPGHALTPALQWVVERAQDATGARYNCVLLNCYRGGKDSVSWHADDEAELGPDPLIASISLGQVRRFELRHRTLWDDPAHRRDANLKFDLAHGSLLFMGSGVQRHWHHRIPKQPGLADQIRINLTMRYMP